MKYQLPNEQGEVLPNRLGLTDEASIGIAEFEGFLRAEVLLTQQLTGRTKFNARYIYKIHQLALGNVYSFAGKLRGGEHKAAF